MSDKTKRLLTIAIFITLVIAMAYGLWWFFFKPVFVPAPVVPPEIAALPTAGLPPALPSIKTTAPREVIPEGAAPSPTAQGNITQTNSIGSNPILSPSISSDGKSLQYYNRDDGKFYYLKTDGTIGSLSDQVFYNVSTVSWAPDKNNAILEYPDGSNIIYDFQTKKQTTLPRHWQKFSFSPESDRIAFLSMGQDADSKWLATASLDGSNTKPIEPLGENASKVQVAWSPNNQIIAFSQTGFPQELNEQEILLIGQNGENFKSLKVNGIGFRGQWSPDGVQILYNVTSGDNDWKPMLWVADGATNSIGANKKTLALNTWANKCSFYDSTVIYCAVPKTLPRGVGLYPDAVGNTPDQLWKINIATNQKELIAIPSEDYTINNIVVSPNGQTLYFTDAISGRLYDIKLR